MNRSQQRLKQAIDYIECHLEHDVCLAGIADAAHLSQYHFARLFRATFGDSAMGYVRRRQLANAVRRLNNADASVLDVAVDSGFGSHEAFTRAFRREYGISPRTFRQNSDLTVPLQGTLTMSETADIQLTPRMETRPGFCAVGYAGEFTPGATQDIGQLWQRFGPVMMGIPNRVGDDSFGICMPDTAASIEENGQFSYMAAVAVENLDAIPQGMTGITIPEKTYAVFSYGGGIGPELSNTMAAIFGSWLPESGYEADGADFEHYTDEFDPVSGTGVFYICVPVKQA